MVAGGGTRLPFGFFLLILDAFELRLVRSGAFGGVGVFEVGVGVEVGVSGAEPSLHWRWRRSCTACSTCCWISCGMPLSAWGRSVSSSATVGM